MNCNNSWGQVLKRVWDLVIPECNEKGFEILLVGSGSTFLQGCTVQPNDIDLLALTPEAVECVAELLQGYEVEESPSQEIDNWLSSKVLRVLAIDGENGSEKWRMGRWIIEGIKVEVAYLESVSSVQRSRQQDYIWENGPDMYPHIKEVHYQGSAINVIPLELQLGTNIFRGLEERVMAIIRVMRESGYDRELLTKALTPDQLTSVKPLLS